MYFVNNWITYTVSIDCLSSSYCSISLSYFLILFCISVEQVQMLCSGLSCHRWHDSAAVKASDSRLRNVASGTLNTTIPYHKASYMLSRCRRFDKFNGTTAYR